MQMNSQLNHWAKGYVRGEYVNLKTGERFTAFERRNVITFTGADIMARLLGGDMTYLPNYMGFIYGATGTPGAALIEPPTSRLQTWSDLSTELSDVGVTGNVLVAPLSAGPLYTRDGSASYYTANAVTLTAHSGSQLEYAFPTSAPYSDELTDGDYFWHAMLLARIVNGNTKTYYPFARVTLKDASYPQKLVGFELALFWQISYF